MSRTLVSSIAAGAALLTTSLAFGGSGIAPLKSVRVASNLDHTVFATHAPDDYTRLFIVEKQGRIKILNLVTNTIQSTFLNIDSSVIGGTSTSNEQGLLGLAFHPEYQDNGKFYVYYTAAGGGSAGNTRVVEYERLTSDTADASSGNLVLSINQPLGNHNGGWIGFNPITAAQPEQYLYIATGDGGGAGDNFGSFGNAQDITNNLLGKLLRIDINGDDFPSDSTRDYAVPASNPFVGITGDDEIWAYGLRNPWRCSFDRIKGNLVIADVGQNAWEELNFQRFNSSGGENYGWRCREGNACFNSNCNVSSACGANPSPSLMAPVHVYSHSTGFSITGGYTYGGCRIESLRGTYFFADYGFQRIWSITGLPSGSVVNRLGELGTSEGGFTVNQISSFGEDAFGEMYIVDQGNGSTGQVFRIEPVTEEVVPSDINCDRKVDVEDILAIINAWGPCDGCREDFILGNGIVDTEELLSAINNWTP